jgi:chaperone modulatory protein CbpM
MQKEDIVPANEFCVHHNLELSFIRSLSEHGLIETVVEEGHIFLRVSELGRLEKIVRLHFELDINLEGIETIAHLLERMEGMQRQIAQLNNRLKAYGEHYPEAD